MVTINVAYTAPINPAGATPVLTVEQVYSAPIFLPTILVPCSLPESRKRREA